MEDLMEELMEDLVVLNRDTSIGAKIVSRQGLMVPRTRFESKLPKSKRGSHRLRHTRYFHWRQKHVEARLDGAKDDVELKQLLSKIGSPTFCHTRYFHCRQNRLEAWLKTILNPSNL